MNDSPHRNSRPSTGRDQLQAYPKIHRIALYRRCGQPDLSEKAPPSIYVNFELTGMND